MKKLKLLSLIGITSIALANTGWAAGHGGGGGGFGGGGFSGGGHSGGGGRAGPTGGGVRGGGGFRGGTGFHSRGPGFSGRPFNGRMVRIDERNDANCHNQWVANNCGIAPSERRNRRLVGAMEVGALSDAHF